MIVQMFASIDYLIHIIMIEIFDLIFRIAEVNIFTDTAIKDFTTRIYGILGVIILFKIVISAIQYLISPDKILDKDKGIGGLLQRTIISVALLALVPSIFDFAKVVQDYVVEAIPQIILGQEIDITSDDGMSDTRAIATDLSLMTLRAFILDKSTATDTTSAQPAELGDKISDYLKAETITKGCDWFGFGDNCAYDYNWLFSILVGAFMVYIFLSIGIDVGIRTIKMGILQILAPIPISSYINSEENFKAWYQMAFKVYADLFIRLIIIYFIVYVISALTNPIDAGLDGIASGIGEFIHDPLLFIYLIIALLIFAKSAPKFICEALGIKSDGFGDMGEMFKPVWQRAAAPAAALANPARNAYDNWAYARKNGRGVGESLRRALGGAAAGTRDAFSAISQGKSAADIKQMRDASKLKSQHRVNRAYQRDMKKDEHTGLRKRLDELLIGIDPARNKELRTSALKAYNSELEAKKNLLDNKMTEFKNTTDPVRSSQLAKEISTLQGEITAFEKGKKVYIAKRIIEEKYNDDVKAKSSDIQTIEDNIANGVYDTTEKKMQAIEKLEKLKEEYATMTSDKDEYIGKLQKEYEDAYGTYSDPDWNAGFTIKDTIMAKYNEEIGVAGLSGSAYTQVADILKSNRSGLWSGEAMTKLTQNPDILVLSGGQGEFESKIVKNPDGTPKKISYSEIRDLNVRVQTGRITQKELNDLGYKNAAELQAAYTDIEKSAATEYINLAMNGKLKGGNSTVTETLKRMEVELSNAGITPREKAALLEEFKKNPGKFLATASDRQERLRTKGSQISSYNSGKKDGQ